MNEMPELAGRPRCPVCGDVLIEGECIAHGVVEPRAGTPEEEAASPVPAAPAGVQTWKTPDPFAASAPEPEELRPPREGSAVRSAPRTAGRAPWIIAAAIALLSVITSGIMLQQQGDLSRRITVLGDRLEELDSGVTESMSGVDKRLGALEKEVASQVDFGAIARKVLPSVFTIETDLGLGSGWVYSSSGGRSTLITNYHVVGEASTVEVKQEDRGTLRGRVTGVDRENDLARIEVSRTLPALEVSNDVPRAGDPVVVIGSPLGLGGTVTTGVVSGRQEGLLQFSAPVSPGNSGGPVLDGSGKVIGVAVLKISGFGAEGLSFAVPVSQICSRVVDC